MAIVLHDIPGRFRIRMPDLKANPDLASEIEERVQGMSGVRSATASPLTGSVIIHYDGSGNAREQILSTLEAQTQTPASPQPSIDVSGRIAEVLCDRLLDLAVRATLRAIL